MRQNLSQFAIVILVSLTLCASMFALSSNVSSAESSGTKKVYYSTDGVYVAVTQPNLLVQIRMARISGHSGGEITTVMYKGSGNIINSDPQFGQLTVYNPESKTKISLYISSTNLVSANGNNTGQLTLIFAATEAQSESGQTLAVSTLIKYVFYADIDDVFVNVEFNFSQKTWLLAGSSYGASLNFVPFQTYNMTGYEYHNYASGSLSQKGQAVISNDPKYNILTLKNPSANLAVTLFPTSIFLVLGTIGDYVSSSKMGLAYSPARTWDGSWIDYGSYFTGGISYSCAWAFSSDGNPFVVTPWIMPNSTPYGIYWTLDDLPASRGYTYTPPSPLASEMTNLTLWLNGGTGTTRRVTVLWSYDQIANGIYPPNPGGLDQSWTVHGSLRIDNMSIQNRNYYASIYGQQVGYGFHSYHHDYPWTWEFSRVTNTSWINATWNQIYLDSQAFLGNITLNTWKAAGYRIQPNALNIITKYNIQQYETAADRRLVPLYCFFTDDVGNHLVGTIDGNTSPDDVNAGKTTEEVASDLIGNITTFGLDSTAGHFLQNNPNWATLNNAFAQVESYFGDSLDYFFTIDLNDYWLNVLWNNNYTFNTTKITSSSKDTRLTYLLLNRPLTFNIDNGLSCSVDKPIFHELYSPNFDTKGWKFTRVTGYATVANINDSNNLLTFTITKPLNTMSSVKIFMPQGEPVSIVGADSFSYDSNTRILTLHTGKNASTSIIIINYQSTTITGSLIIAGGAAYTKSTTVSLTLSASSATSGISQMRLSNDGVFDTEQWETNIASKSWTLASGDGIKTACVQFKDNAGLVSLTYSDTIILDTTQPIVTISSPAEGEKITSSTVTLTWSGSDSSSGLDKYEVKLDSGTWIDKGVASSHTFNGVSIGSHTIYVRAIDKAGQFQESQRSFSVQSPPEQVAAPTFSPVSGTYQSAQSVSISSSTTGATIRYTTDGSEPTPSSTTYAVSIAVNGNMTINAKAFKAGLLDSNTASATYTISIPSSPASSPSQATDKVAMPTFNPTGGTYDKAQLITIQSNTSGAIIRYTANGDEPTYSSMIYTYPIAVTDKITIKAKAFKSGMIDSTTVSATYNIQLPLDDVLPTLSVSLNKQNLVFTILLEDNVNGSRIANITLYIDSNPVQTWTTNGTLVHSGGPYSEGTHTYYAEAFDNANNVVRDPAIGTEEFIISPEQTQTISQPIELRVILAFVFLIATGSAIGFLVTRRLKK